jgi:hypothetical protein
MFFFKLLVFPSCEVLVALLTKIQDGYDITPYRLKWEFAANILRLVKSSFTLETALELVEAHQSARRYIQE